MIKFTNLERCYDELKEQLVPAYDEIQKSGSGIDGKYCSLVENELKSITGRKHAKLYPSGTSAILGALLAWDIYDKKVALSNYSYVASANQAALINGVEFFDVDENGLIDIKETIKHDACIPVSLYGNTVDYDLFFGLMSDQTKVIVDSAQSLGTTYKNKPDGSFGDASVFSFASNKPVPTSGTHGALLWDDDSMVDPIRSTSNNGKLSRNAPISHLGINGVPYELQACQIYFGLQKYKIWQERRKHISEYYTEQFIDLPVQFIVSGDHCESNYHKYIILHPQRADLVSYLRENDIDAQMHYTDNFNMVFGDKTDMPMTERLTKQVISLPNHQWLTDAEVETVANTVKGYFA